MPLTTKCVFICGLLLFLIPLTRVNTAFSFDVGEVEKTLGVPGHAQEGVIVFAFPRSDIKVVIDNEPVPTASGFSSWTAWKSVGGKVMVMGDLVLLENEINPVISALEEADIQVTGLHNHFLHEQPRVMYLHIYGTGLPAVLSRGIKNALEKTGTPERPSSTTDTSQPVLALDTKRIEQIMGHLGQVTGGVFKIALGRRGVRMHGIELTTSMGLNSWAAFIGTNEHAHVAGDIAMTAREVNRVIRALRRGSLEICAVHNHMLDDKPHIFFLHYWGTGPAEKLAQTVRAAFDEVKGPIK